MKPIRSLQMSGGIVDRGRQRQHRRLPLSCLSLDLAEQQRAKALVPVPRRDLELNEMDSVGRFDLHTTASEERHPAVKAPMNPIDRMAVPTTILRGGMSPSVESSANPTGSSSSSRTMTSAVSSLKDLTSSAARNAFAAAAEPAIVTARATAIGTE